jgi:hypothetical protein
MDKNQLNSPNKYFHNRQGKVKYFQGQMKKVFTAFYSQPKTMLMVSVETGILRANICRHVAALRKENRVTVYRKGICPLTKCRAGFYTTNPEMFPKACLTPKTETV